ncbi:MAG: UDP-N-acetylmuramate--L-alanine ligase [Coriobacteriales bacterium]|jgi:UDP-N-acetylmuramate--alanine ligase|nr:UDP-N-acetylmuramate--L-alanine ligase [Coriobacteriales bacterium]
MTPRRIHFIGIGGSGMSGIALTAHKRGMKVSGSDLKVSNYMQALLRAGIDVRIGHDAANVSDPSIDVVVVSTAIPRSNPEYAYALEHGLTIWPRARMLAYLGDGSDVLAVSGTHGKTTTSSMLATALMKLGSDPTFLIGGVVDAVNSTSHAGDGKYFVVEADESDGSFVWLAPKLSIVTNIEADHLDHYENLEEIKFAFRAFLDKLALDGAAIVCAESPGLPELARSSGKRVITYGLAKASGAVVESDLVKSGISDETYADMLENDAIADVAPDVQCVVKGQRDFSVCFSDGESVDITLDVSPGVHNMLNATAVMATLDYLGFNRKDAARAISGFTGVRRRFDHVGEAGGIQVVDDYGHHPTEIAATIKAARRLGYEHIHVLFQPHRYTRTQAFLGQFASAFDGADSLTLMDIYSAGEKPLEGVTSAALLDRIQSHVGSPVSKITSCREDIPQAMADIARPGDIILTMGAGDVTEMGPLIVAELERTFKATQK